MRMCLNQDLVPVIYGWCSEGQAAFRVKRVKLIYVVVYSKQNLIRFATMIYILYKVFNHKIYLKETFIFFKPCVIYRQKRINRP